MFPKDIWFNPIWCLYDNTRGEVILKHPWHKGLRVPCPHCGKTLIVENYMATCCNQEFRVSFNEIAQRQPVGTHQRYKGRGWASLRPYVKSFRCPSVG